jgi:hypothetical protein
MADMFMTNCLIISVRWSESAVAEGFSVVDMTGTVEIKIAVDQLLHK